MSWECPKCGNNNLDDVIKCACDSVDNKEENKQISEYVLIPKIPLVCRIIGWFLIIPGAIWVAFGISVFITNGVEEQDGGFIFILCLITVCFILAPMTMLSGKKAGLNIMILSFFLAGVGGILNLDNLNIKIALRIESNNEFIFYLIYLIAIWIVTIYLFTCRGTFDEIEECRRNQ